MCFDRLSTNGIQKGSFWPCGRLRFLGFARYDKGEVEVRREGERRFANPPYGVRREVVGRLSASLRT